MSLHEWSGGSAGGSGGGFGPQKQGGGGGADEIEGVTKDDAKKFQQDIFSVLSNSKFNKLKELITIKGKGFVSIDSKLLEAALNGVDLSADEKAYIDTLVGTINSKDVHKIQYLSLTDRASSEGEKLFIDDVSKNLTPIIGPINGSNIYAVVGQGYNIPTNYGSFSFVIDVFSDIPRYETSMHEPLGHGIPSARKMSQNINNANAIRMSNLIRRITGYTTTYRDGTNPFHYGGLVSFPFNLSLNKGYDKIYFNNVFYINF